MNTSVFCLGDGSTAKIEYHKSLSSTTALAKEYASRGYPDRYVIISEKQFVSNILRSKLTENEGEEGIFISILLRPALFPSQLSSLAPLSATALLTALESHTEKELGISWLSDIYCEGERIGGVGIEGKLDSFSAFEYLIVSFAVKSDKENFPPRITDMIRQVFEGENESVGMIVAKSIINRFFHVYREIKSPDKHISLYRRRFILNGKKIQYISEGKKKRCRVIGLEPNGFGLLCETSSGKGMTLSSPSLAFIPKTIK